MLTPSGSRRLWQVTALLVGLGGIALVLLAAVEGYQTGVDADEQGTSGHVTALEVGGILIGATLVVVAIVQLAALRRSDNR